MEKSLLPVLFCLTPCLASVIFSCLSVNLFTDFYVYALRGCVSREATEEGIKFSRAGVTGTCDLPYVSAGT